MKRFITYFIASMFLVVLGGTILFHAVPVSAQADPYGLETTRKATPQYSGASKTLPEIIGSILSVALSLIGFVFLGLALYAGFKWMTAQGNEKDVTTAKDTLINATIGIVLIVAAYAITNFIFSDVIAKIQ